MHHMLLDVQKFKSKQEYKYKAAGEERNLVLYVYI